MMDFQFEGVRWWSIIILDGYSRTMLAGAVSASEASWIALTVLFTACQRYGAPQYLISDKGSAYISNVVEAVCKRLGIDHRTITGKDGESYMNLMVTVDRRIAPPAAAPDRRMMVSSHAAPQYPDACHAYLAGDTPCVPAFSHHGNVHGALAS